MLWGRSFGRGDSESERRGEFAMIRSLGQKLAVRSGYAGLRLSAEEYYALPDDGNRYELIDGVVHMSPSPGADHQYVASIIFHEVMTHVRKHRLGMVFFELDVNFGKALGGENLVYRPEIIFIATERLAQVSKKRVEIVPDLVVEIISPDSRGLDSITKFQDYERAGVKEYWLIDPPNEKMTFYRLSDGKFIEGLATDAHFESKAVPGLLLDVAAIRSAFRMIPD